MAAALPMPDEPPMTMALGGASVLARERGSQTASIILVVLTTPGRRDRVVGRQAQARRRATSRPVDYFDHVHRHALPTAPRLPSGRPDSLRHLLHVPRHRRRRLGRPRGGLPVGSALSRRSGRAALRAGVAGQRLGAARARRLREPRRAARPAAAQPDQRGPLPRRQRRVVSRARLSRAVRAQPRGRPCGAAGPELAPAARPAVDPAAAARRRRCPRRAAQARVVGRRGGGSAAGGRRWRCAALAQRARRGHAAGAALHHALLRARVQARVGLVHDGRRRLRPRAAARARRPVRRGRAARRDAVRLLGGAVRRARGPRRRLHRPPGL